MTYAMTLSICKLDEVLYCASAGTWTCFTQVLYQSLHWQEAHTTGCKVTVQTHREHANQISWHMY